MQYRQVSLHQVGHAPVLIVTTQDNWKSIEMRATNPEWKVGGLTHLSSVLEAKRAETFHRETANLDNRTLGGYSTHSTRKVAFPSC